MNTPQIFQDLINAAHQNSIEKGFWDSSQNIGEKVALTHSELSEFLETHRKDATKMDEHCPEFTNEEIELADVLIRVFDLAGWLKLRLGEAVLAKMEYNKSRPHMHGKKF